MENDDKKWMAIYRISTSFNPEDIEKEKPIVAWEAINIMDENPTKSPSENFAGYIAVLKKENPDLIILVPPTDSE